MKVASAVIGVVLLSYPTVGNAQPPDLPVTVNAVAGQATASHVSVVQTGPMTMGIYRISGVDEFVVDILNLTGVPAGYLDWQREPVGIATMDLWFAVAETWGSGGGVTRGFDLCDLVTGDCSVMPPPASDYSMLYPSNHEGILTYAAWYDYYNVPPVMEIWYEDLIFGGGPVWVGYGEEPDMGNGVIAYSHSGDLELYDLGSGFSLAYSSVLGDISEPTVGGLRVAYSISTATGSSIGVRSLTQPSVETLIPTICAEQKGPRVSKDGSKVLFTADDCPPGVKPGLYLTYFKPGALRTYLVESDLSAFDRNSYSIGSTTLAYTDVKLQVKYVAIDVTEINKP
ncbi:MAG TPA: hypothetical protein VN033_00330 [Vulgatibacter sp.]|nr:hypothetical protein [Vulgatibacter sp.]